MCVNVKGVLNFVILNTSILEHIDNGFLCWLFLHNHNFEVCNGGLWIFKQSHVFFATVLVISISSCDNKNCRQF